MFHGSQSDLSRFSRDGTVIIFLQYEHNAEELDKAREQAENDCNSYDQLAPGTEQTEQEDIAEGAIEAEQYVHFNPDRPTEQRVYDIFLYHQDFLLLVNINVYAMLGSKL
jgi:hypothetical protein